MTPLDAALKLATPQAQVAGLWLAAHSGIPSIGPVQGMQLLDIRLKAWELLQHEPDPIARADVAAFINALDLVINVELVHQGAIIGMFERWVEDPDGKN